MSKLLRAFLAATLLMAVAPNRASAVIPPAPAPVVFGSAGAGAGAAITGGFLGFIALLVTYDLIRRTTCSGDFLHLGGPGSIRRSPRR